MSKLFKQFYTDTSTLLHAPMPRNLEYVGHHFDGPFELWREHLGAMFDAAPILSTADSTPFSARVYVHKYGAIERASYGGVMFDHATRHADASSGMISVTRYPAGGPVEPRISLSPSIRSRVLFLFDHSVTYKSLHFPAKLENIYLLKTALGLAETDQVPARRFIPGTPVADLLNSELDRVYSAMHDPSPIFSERAFLRFAACVRAVLRGRIPPGPERMLARDAVFDLIRDYIQANLGDPRLGPRDLLKNFGVSRPTLYRMFAPYGGVRNYIAHHRLIRAAYDLSSKDTRRGEIARIAERWGFRSSLQFNRAIRGAFNTAPTDLFGAPLSPPSVTKHFAYLKGYINPPD
jgi:AraC-like DNA-binding protein